MQLSLFTRHGETLDLRLSEPDKIARRRFRYDPRSGNGEWKIPLLQNVTTH